MIKFMLKIKITFAQFWNAFKVSFGTFSKNDTSTLGAALSYYTIFSIAPIIIIVLSVVGAIFGHNAVEGELQRQLQGLFGNDSASFWQDIVKAAYKPGKNIIIAIIAVVILIIAASSVFSQLRTSLNIIWNVKEVAKKPVSKFIVDRLFSFAGIACLAFLLLISLVVHTGLEALADYINRKASVPFLLIINALLSFVITVFLFSIIYKFMSDAKIKWKDVWWGSFFTAVLFVIGKYLIAVFIGKSNFAGEYGAAGSVVAVLFWVFYSSQIFFFGAEFTRALAAEKGICLDPVSVNEGTRRGSIKTITV